MRTGVFGLWAFLALALVRTPSWAQVARVPPTLPYRNVVSGSPLMWVSEAWPDFEYERQIAANTTVGLRTTRLTWETSQTGKATEDERHTSGRAFIRYYPSEAFTRFFFAVGFGATDVKKSDEEFTGMAAGFELGYGWMLGARRRYYLSVGGGLDRLFGLDVGHDLKFIPTIRLVNVGIAF